jgi:hypothetical protein
VDSRIVKSAQFVNEGSQPAKRSNIPHSASSHIRLCAAFTVLGAGVLIAVWPIESIPLLSLLLLAASLALTVTGAKVRSLIGAYVAVAAFSFLIAPVLNGTSLRFMATVWALASVWFAGWAAGQYLVGRAASPPQSVIIETSGSIPKSTLKALVIVGGASMVIQLVLLSRGAIGYGAQVRGFSSVGPLALFSTVGPISIASAYVLATIHKGRAKNWRRVCLFLVAAQAFTIAQTGFRGAGPLYILTIWLVRKRWDPRWHIGLRQAVAAATAVLAITMLFTVGARERAREAYDSGNVSAGSRLRPLTELPTVVLERFDHSEPLNRALERAEFPASRQAVSPRSQLVAFVPRAVWPSKPDIDYGQQIAQVFFDIPTIYTTASSITWMGDLYVQGGHGIVLIVGLLVGALVQSRLRQGATAVDPIHVGAYFLLAQALLALETPLLIAGATALRTFVAFVGTYLLACLALRVVARRPLPGLGARRARDASCRSVAQHAGRGEFSTTSRRADGRSLANEY